MFCISDALSSFKMTVRVKSTPAQQCSTKPVDQVPDAPDYPTSNNASDEHHAHAQFGGGGAPTRAYGKTLLNGLLPVKTVNPTFSTYHVSLSHSGFTPISPYTSC